MSLKSTLKKGLLAGALIFGISTSVFAATDTFSVNLYPDKNSYVLGETVTIPVCLENVDVENGIVAYNFLLNYDTNVFENVTFDKTENWDTATNMGGVIQGFTETKENIIGDQKITEIKLKVKDNAKTGNTEIDISKFDATNEERTISNIGASINLEIANSDGSKNDIVIDDSTDKEDNNDLVQITTIAVITAIAIGILIGVYIVEVKSKKSKAEEETKDENKTIKEKNDSKDETKENEVEESEEPEETIESKVEEILLEKSEKNDLEEMLLDKKELKKQKAKRKNKKKTEELKDETEEKLEESKSETKEKSDEKTEE